MDDASGDADANTENDCHICNDTGCSLWYVNTIGYAFLCIQTHMRS